VSFVPRTKSQARDHTDRRYKDSRGYIASLRGPESAGRIRVPTAGSGAPLPPEDVSVAAASWGSADPFEQGAHDLD
jgi:hypothetical protein